MPGLHVVSGASQSDTIATTLAQALVMEVVPVDGVRPNIVVLFDAAAAQGAPAVEIAPLSAPDALGSSASVPTDARGRSIVRVRLGFKAGRATVHVSVPEYGFRADVPFDVEVGQAAAIIVAPQDTLVDVGASFPSRSRVVDRAGNPRPEAVTLAEPTSNLTIAGDQVTVIAKGRGTIAVRSGQLQSEMRVYVGIFAGITGLTPTRLVHFDPNGTVAVAVERATGAPFTADWSPDGELLVADNGGFGPMFAISAQGETRVLGGTPVAWPLYPEFSRDGQWIYYSRSDLGWHIRRMRPDGSGDEAVAGIPTNRVAPTLSPDGRFIAVVNITPDRLEIFEVGTGRLIQIAENAHTPAWSPDGSRIAFVNTTTSQVEVINPDGTNRRVISPFGRSFNLGIDWSGDGTLVVGRDLSLGAIIAIDPVTLLTKEYRYPEVGAPASRFHDGQ